MSFRQQWRDATPLARRAFISSGVMAVLPLAVTTAVFVSDQTRPWWPFAAAAVVFIALTVWVVVGARRDQQR